MRDVNLIKKWWGANDWKAVMDMKPDKIKDRLVERFKTELGYQSAKAWPIYGRAEGNTVMYYMIHATDHHEAPELMARAYNEAVRSLDVAEQIELFT